MSLWLLFWLHNTHTRARMHTCTQRGLYNYKMNWSQPLNHWLYWQLCEHVTVTFSSINALSCVLPISILIASCVNIIILIKHLPNTVTLMQLQHDLILHLIKLTSSFILISQCTILIILSLKNTSWTQDVAMNGKPNKSETWAIR